MSKRAPTAEGHVLRLARLAQDRAQKDLCAGLCAVSTLSKIERGRQAADPHLLAALYARLGIHYHGHEPFVSTHRKKLDASFAARRLAIPVDWELPAELLAADLSLSQSPLALDWALLKLSTLEGMEPARRKALVEQLKALRPVMSRAQEAWYLSFAPAPSPAESFAQRDLAYQLVHDALMGVRRMQAAFRAGHYRQVLAAHAEVRTLALQEGNLIRLVEALTLSGSAYAAFGMLPLMRPLYAQSLALLSHVSYPSLKALIHYNAGASYLAAGQLQEAAQHFEQIPQNETRPPQQDFMHWHKRCLLAHRLGDEDSAKKAYQRLCLAEEHLSSLPVETGGHPQALLREMRQLARLECEGQLHGPEALKLLSSLMSRCEREALYGFMIFYRPLFLECLKAQRQYKKALAFETTLAELRTRYFA